MREIKFRSYTPSGMVEIDKIVFKTGMAIFDDVHGEQGFSTEEFPLMQYTGCKDTNGIEIYDGDIIEFVWEEDSCWGDEGTYRGYVQHDDGGYEVVYINRQEYTICKDGGRHPNSESDELQSFIRWTNNVNIKVIGNRFENPELLEE